MGRSGFDMISKSSLFVSIVSMGIEMNSPGEAG